MKWLSLINAKEMYILQRKMSIHLRQTRNLTHFQDNFIAFKPDLYHRKHLLCEHKSKSILYHRCERHLSTETYDRYFASDVAPIGLAEKTLETVHSVSGLPWWASIGLTAFVLRTIITLPLTIYSAKIHAKVEKLQPQIMDMSKLLRLEVAHASKKYKWSQNKSRKIYNQTMKKKIGQLYVRDNCHPFKSTVCVWVQIPMWISISFALRNMSGAVPSLELESQAVAYPALKTEGTLWFQDLTLPDSTFILPLTIGVLTLLNIEMFTLQRRDPGKFQKRLTYFLRGMVLFIVPISGMVPSSMCCYWVTSSLFGLLQNVLLKVPTVKRFVRIEKTGSESATPFKDIKENAKWRYMKKTS